MTDNASITRSIDRLRRLHRAVLKGRPCYLPDGAVTALDDLERRLIEAVRRDESGSPEPDGYPTGSLGNGGEDAAQSSTEAAALALADPERRAVIDRHHGLTEAARTALDDAVAAIDRLAEKLDAIDRLASIDRTDPSGYCNACTRWVEGTAADRIRSGYCDACRKAWERAGRPDRVEFERQRRSTSAA